MFTLSMMTALAGSNPEISRPSRGAGAMQVTGIALTANGAMIAAAGGALILSPALNKSDCADSTPDCGSGAVYALAVGMGVAATSVPFLAAGIPMWVMGNHRVRKTRDQPAVTVQLAPMVSRPGLVLAGRW